MYKQIIKDKFKLLGFVLENIDEKLEELNNLIPLSQYSALELDEKIQIIQYEKPNQEISKFYLNREFEKFFLLHGKINYTKQELLGEFSFDFVDFPLTENLCMIGMTKENNIKILMFLPNYDTIVRYSNKKYEEVFSPMRNELMDNYVQSIIAKKTLTIEQINKIVNLLATDYVIDKIMIENVSPKLKLYYNIVNFAETITNYKYKYINKIENCVQKIEKKNIVKYIEKNISIGNISNDPYLSLEDSKDVVDFNLKEPSYVWFSTNGRGQDELAVFTAKQDYNEKTYREWLKQGEDNELKQEAEKLSAFFSAEVGEFVSVEYVLECLRKLNRELIVIPTELFKNGITENLDGIELPRYKYRVLTNPEEFEPFLYNTIEEKLNKRYLYRSIEMVNGLYTKIGNNIKYTDINGQEFNEKSIADFNQNANVVILKKETFLSKEIISEIRNKGLHAEEIDTLPVPILEVIFYFPKEKNSSEIDMYNKTNIEEVFQDANKKEQTSENKKKNTPRYSNLKEVKIRCITDQGEALNEMIIKDLLAGELYTPEKNLILKDSKGREWICEKNYNAIYVSENNKQNIIEMVYNKRLANLQVNYITQSGSVLKEPIKEKVQIGEKYSLVGTDRFIDSSGLERRLCCAYKENIIVSEKEEENIINLIYGDEKTNVLISYLTIDDVEIKESELELATINEEFSPNIKRTILDKEGLQWRYLESSSPKLYVEKNKTNIIKLYYEKHMQKMIIRYIDESSNIIKEDEIQEVQVGEKILIKQEPIYIDDVGKYWKSSSDNKGFHIVSDEEENIVLVKYLPVLENVTLLFQDKDGNELKSRKSVLAQIGTLFNNKPAKSVKDKKGNEWKLISNEQNEIIVKESEKENVISYIYEVAKAKVRIRYLKINGENLQKEECLLKQVGSGLVPTPEALVYDNENLCWKISRIQPAILKVNDGENEIVITYEQALGKVVWKYLDVNGNPLKEEDVQWIQIGTHYSPLVQERVIYKSEEVWKLMEIKPREIIVSENEEENVIELIYSNAK